MQGRLHASPSVASSKECAQAPRQAWRAPPPPPGRTRVPDEAGPQVHLQGTEREPQVAVVSLPQRGRASHAGCRAQGNAQSFWGDVEVVL